MVRLIEKIFPQKDSTMQWNTQAVNITTNIKVQIDFTSPALSATNDVMWDFHMDDSANSRYDMILGRYILT